MPIVKGFRPFHSNIVSSRQVATEISNLVSGSNVEQSGRASAASLTSNRPIKKRVASAERRERLISFVNKYRAMNLGKFPSPTTAKKEVGGGYYSIKKILQEMEYNSKMSAVEEGRPTMEHIQHVEKGQITIEKFDKSSDTGNNNITIDDAQRIATESDGKPEQSPRDNNFAFKDLESQVEKQPDEVRNVSPRDDNFAFKDPESQVEKQPDEIRNVMRDKGEEDNELREKASLWGNLKSMANEFINMWKK